MKAIHTEILEDGTRVKQCSRCKEKKPLDSFQKRTSSITGYAYVCKDCGVVVHRESRYSLKDSDFQELLASQNNGCAICGITNDEHYIKTKHSLHVDHDHKTGEVRGLLCRICNKGIGCLQDEYETVQKAADYLLKYKVT